jgi:hypothetical protein
MLWSIHASNAQQLVLKIAPYSNFIIQNSLLLESAKPVGADCHKDSSLICHNGGVFKSSGTD